MMKRFSYFMGAWVLLLLLPACNFLGNPHPKRQAARLVAIQGPKIEVTPATYRLQEQKDTVSVRLEMENISEYTLALSRHKGISLLSYNEVEPNVYEAVLKLSKKAQPERVHFYLKKEQTEHIAAFRFLPKNGKTKHRRHHKKMPTEL